MTKPDPLTGPLVRFARGVRYTDLTPSTVHAIVRNLLDTGGRLIRDIDDKAAGLSARAANLLHECTGGGCIHVDEPDTTATPRKA